MSYFMLKDYEAMDEISKYTVWLYIVIQLYIITLIMNCLSFYRRYITILNNQI